MQGVAIGFNLAFDWLTWWRECPGPIIEHSEAQPVRITLDTQSTISQ